MVSTPPLYLLQDRFPNISTVWWPFLMHEAPLETPNVADSNEPLRMQIRPVDAKISIPSPPEESRYGYLCNRCAESHQNLCAILVHYISIQWSHTPIL